MPTSPVAVYVHTTPSVFAGPPGNCAYPRRLDPKSHTQKFKYSAAGHASEPPCELNFMLSLVPNWVTDVGTRKIPSDGFP